MLRFSSNPERIELAGGLVDIQAAEGGDGNAVPRAALNVYNGGPMRPQGFDIDVVVNLAGLSIMSGPRPLLLDHDRSKIVGHAEKVTVGESVDAEGFISGGGAAAEEVLAAARKKFPWRASMGASIQQMHELDAGETEAVNGREISGPAVIVDRATLHEVSFVSLAGDNTTHTSVAASLNGANEMRKEFKLWLKAKGLAEDISGDKLKAAQGEFDEFVKRVKAAGFEITASTTEQQMRFLVAAGSGEPASDPAAPATTPAPAPAAPATVTAGGPQVGPDQLRADMAAEVERINAIRDLTESHPELQAQAIRENWDATRTELAVLRAQRTPGPGLAIHVENGEGRTLRAMEASLCLSAGVREESVVQSYGEGTVENSRKYFRRFGLHAAFAEFLRANGHYVPYGQFGDEQIRAAFIVERGLMAAADYGTHSLSGILSNVANKRLMDSFTAVSSILVRIAAPSDLRDFKTHNRYRLTGSGAFEKVAASGEINHGDLQDETYPESLDTYGKIYSLSRQMIINDDLGAFAQLFSILGRGAGLAREKEGFTVLLNAVSSGYFAAGNNNYLTGASTALAIDSLTTAEQLFLDQTDANGDPVMPAPAILLVPTALKVPAERLMSSLQVNEVTAQDKPSPRDNPHAGKFEPIASPYLNAQGLSGQSALAWYLFANPADLPAMTVGYLQGRDTPTVESADLDFNRLGMQFRGFWDFGVQMVDPRAAVKMKGEA